MGEIRLTASLPPTSPEILVPGIHLASRGRLAALKAHS
jgi:hypothetical protein